MFDVADQTLAERLAALLAKSRFRMTPGLLGKISGLPKATLVNWLEGRVTHPRRWQDVARVADALRLPENEATRLLLSAGHLPVRRLLASNPLPEDEQLLALWANELSTHDQARRRLPDPGTLVGREEVAAHIGSLATGRCRLVTITGMPGVGKTHLAVNVARSIKTHFDCEPVWIPLGSISGPTGLVGAVATALGQSAQTEATLMQFLARTFSQRSILFVIDNAEHLADAAAAILALLASSSRISVLLTSRSPLRCVGESAIRIVPLAVPNQAEMADPGALRQNAAVRAFCVHADGFDPQRSTDEVIFAIGTVVRHLEGIPLALALAAAQLPLFTPEALAKNLARRFPLLSNARLSVDGRRQTLRSAIDWSFELLSAEQRCMFRRCALFASGWTLPSSAAVLRSDDGPQHWDKFATLTELVEHGLIFAEPDADGEPRFGMLDTMREYALERLSEADDRAETERSFVRYYSRIIGDASRACAANTDAWPAEFFRIEAPNVRAALELAIAGGDAKAALTMATAWSIWETQSDTERALDLTRKALQLPSSVHDGDIVRLRAQAQRTLGILAMERNALAEAAISLGSALDLMARSQDCRGLAIAQCDFAFLSYCLGKDDDCRRYARSALAYFSSITPEPHRELGWVYSNLALADFQAAESASLRSCDAALEHADAADDKRLRAFVYHLTGLLAARSGNFLLAEQKFYASIRECDYEETSTSYACLAGLGIVAAAVGKHQRAVTMFGVADRGLAGVRDFGMTLRHLKEAVCAARESIAAIVPAEKVAAWSRETLASDLRSVVSFQAPR